MICMKSYYGRSKVCITVDMSPNEINSCTVFYTLQSTLSERQEGRERTEHLHTRQCFNTEMNLKLIKKKQTTHFIHILRKASTGPELDKKTKRRGVRMREKTREATLIKWCLLHWKIQVKSTTNEIVSHSRAFDLVLKLSVCLVSLCLFISPKKK